MWKSFQRKARRARELSFADWLALTEAWFALFAFYFAVRWMSYARLSAAPNIEPNPSAALADARRLQRLVGWAARAHLLPMTCLVQSLSLRGMLARRGIGSALRIGAAKDPRGFHAHAWLEVDGEKVGESEDVEGLFHVLRGGTSPPTTS